MKKGISFIPALLFANFVFAQDHLNVSNIEVSKPQHISVSHDWMVSGNSTNLKDADDGQLFVNSSASLAEDSNVFLHFKTGTIKGQILKATLYFQAKAQNPKSTVQLYQLIDENFDSDNLNSGIQKEKTHFLDSVLIHNTNVFKMYSISITKSAQVCHSKGNDIIFCLKSKDKSNKPIAIGSLASDSFRSFLVLSTADLSKQKIATQNTSTIIYPAGQGNEAFYENWSHKNPRPNKTSWTPKLWKKYVKQNSVSQLYDFSYAGYKYGEESIPEITKILGKVTDFGAIPNDTIDDTKSIQKALDKLGRKKGVILFPKGQYIINAAPKNFSPLQLNSSNIIIRGEGTGKDGTVLFMKNKYLPEKGYGDFIFNVGNEKPYQKSKKTEALIAEAKRGSKFIRLESTDQFLKGDYIQITLYAGRENNKYRSELSEILTFPLKPEEAWTNYTKYAPYAAFNQIVRVVNENTVELKNPLKIDMSLKWTPRVAKVNFYKNIGFENLRFETAWKGPYRHHGNREMDYGWCALKFENTVDSWVKNVVFHNFTIDMSVKDSKNITLTDILISGVDGHNGINIHDASDILVKNIKYTANRTHSMGGSANMEGCVFTQINIVNKNGMFDFHGGGFAMANLFDSIIGCNVSGGGATQNMPHSGRENTFWNVSAGTSYALKHKGALSKEFFAYGYWNYNTNIKARGNLSYDCYKLYPGSLLIGVYNENSTLEVGKDATDRNTDYIYIEGLNKQNIWPASLYKAQLDLRLNSK